MPSQRAVPVLGGGACRRDRRLPDLRPGLDRVRELRFHPGGRRHAASLHCGQSGLRRHLRRHRAGSSATLGQWDVLTVRDLLVTCVRRAPRVPRSAIGTPSTIATARSAPGRVVTACGEACAHGHTARRGLPHSRNPRGGVAEGTPGPSLHRSRSSCAAEPPSPLVKVPVALSSTRPARTRSSSSPARSPQATGPPSEWRLRAGDESLHTHTGTMKSLMPSTMPSPPTSGISRSRSRRNPTPHCPGTRNSA